MNRKKTNKIHIMKKVAIVFDGTSHYILPLDEVTDDLEVVCKANIDEAQDIAEELNNKYCKG